MIKTFKIFEAIKWYSKGKWEEEIPIEYNDKITDDGFRQFLIDNDAYESYLANCKPDFVFSRCPKHEYINRAFSWWRTTERGDFWVSLHNKWQSEMSEYRMPTDKKLDMYNLHTGDRVICIKNSINTKAAENKKYKREIKAGEIKTVEGAVTQYIWFTDTPNGWGGYPYEDFELY